MSSRVLRKLAGGNDDDIKVPNDNKEEEEDKDDTLGSRGARPKRAQPHKNPFQLVSEIQLSTLCQTC